MSKTGTPSFNSNRYDGTHIQLYNRNMCTVSHLCALTCGFLSCNSVKIQLTNSTRMRFLTCVRQHLMSMLIVLELREELLLILKFVIILLLSFVLFITFLVVFVNLLYFFHAKLKLVSLLML